MTDSFGSRLVLGSTTTGAGSDISVSGIPELTIDGGNVIGTSTSPMDEFSAGSIGAVAVDAKFTVDGMALTSKSNAVDKAVSGLTFNLVSVGKATVTVATNTDGLKASIQKFVDAYNAIANSVTALTKPSLDDEGNPTVSAALTGMRCRVRSCRLFAGLCRKPVRVTSLPCWRNWGLPPTRRPVRSILTAPNSPPP